MALAFALGAAAWSWASGGILYELLRTDLDAAAKIVRLQEFFRACGAWAPLVYAAFVTVEVVVAPIPGLMLYAPGGMIFGPIVGGALALAGNTLGAGLACTLAKRLGAARLERALAVETREQLHEAIARRGVRWVFWLRLNPLTSSDMVSYAAGFAGMSAQGDGSQAADPLASRSRRYPTASSAAFGVALSADRALRRLRRGDGDCRTPTVRRPPPRRRDRRRTEFDAMLIARRLHWAARRALITGA
jgi:uncharacterized membrane protein YdjX (TVP38/TMEM64 family)